MKKIALLFFAFLLQFQLFAQNSPGFKYQALVRDADGVVLTKHAVGLQINLMQGIPDGSPIYSETFTVTSNDFGLINLIIGQGSTTDDFMSIDWANGPYFIEISMDIHGGTDYQLFGTSELMSVPYALHAKTAESVENLSITETDPIFTESGAAGITNSDIKNWNTAYNWGNHQTMGYVTLEGEESLSNKTLISPVILNPSGIVKADIGLENVDNTADSLKPISKATQIALDLKEDLANKSTDTLLAANSDTLYPSQKAIKNYVDTKGGSFENALNNEINRASAAEAANATAITDETSRATAAEATNATAISDETTRASAAETANATAITDETARASAAETANATAITDETTRASAAETANATAISDETTRASAAETANATAITDETARASAAETANATAITDETSRATAAEATNATAISDETARASATETANATAITDETSRATAAETANTAAITNEISRASTAEAGLSNDIATNATAISDETSRATAAEGVNAAAISTETSRATAAEAGLSNDIATNATAIADETSRASAAEAVNATAISDETSRATAAEGVNAAAISTETSRATAAEAGLSNDIATNATAIADETSRASAAEAVNATAIADETSRASAAEAANATAISDETSRATTAEAGLSNDIATNATAISDETSRATAAEGVNATAISDETSRATAAEGVNATAISDETSRATAAEGANAAAISAETSRATVAEAGLSNDIATNATAISDETSRATAAEGVNATAIADETSRASAAEAANATAISDETSRATTAEAGLSNDIATNATAISDEISRATAAEGVNAAAISTETSRATAAEAGLSNDIATNATAIADETSRASAAEAANATAISDETSRATTAEAANATAISNEQARALSAEGVNAAAISTETSRATAAEAANATAISDETSRATTAETGLSNDIATNATAIADETSRASAAEAANATAISDETSRATAAEAANATAISNEQARALSAEGVNAAAISTETSRATAAEGVNATAISDETSRATAAEAANATAISDETTARESRPANAITDSNISNWNTAYGWGNHADAGYLTSYTETDPVYSAWDKSSGISITESQISDLGSYETAFSKNTAFNKNFGTTSGTVAEGNDSRIDNGQTAYGWGNHADAGYLTSYTETDPVYSAWDKSSGISITESQISDLGSYETAFSKNTAFNKNFGTTSGTVMEGNDSRVANGQTAYSWGNHADAGYLTSYTETDPVYSAWDKSSGISITESQISDLGSYETAFSKNTAFNKNFGTTSGTVMEGDDSRVANGQTAYSWGNHADAGYLTSYTETDPVFVASPAYGISNTDISNWNSTSVSSTEKSNWNTAYGWGDHSTQGYLTSESDPVYSAWDKSSGISITESQISDLGSYETAFSKNTAFNKNFGTTSGTVMEGDDSRVANGQTAYSWGNHADAGYLTSETDAVFTASAAGGISSSDISNWNTAFGWGDHSTQGYLKSADLNTLDKAYDQGGAGAGNTITADAGAFTVAGTDGIISTGSIATGTALSVSGIGTRLMWYPKKSAFRVGFVSGSEWDDANIGMYSIAMGYKTEASSDNSTAIGNAAVATGENSFALGYKLTASGPNSTALGNYVSTGSVNGAFAIGDNSTTSVMTTTTANQMNMRFNGGYNLYSNAGASLGVFLAANGNSWSSISDSTKKENIIGADGEYFLSSIAKMKIGSWNYKAQDAKYRHYGPMAQDIFHYFGHDGHGIIGNDTTLCAADMDGIMMISIKALEKRTENTKELSQKVEKLETSVEKLKAIVEEQSKMIENQQILLKAFQEKLKN